MKTYERRQVILTALAEHLELKISTLAEMLGASQGTIRNDLVYLSRTGMVERTRGGATLADRHLISSPQFAARARDKSPNKRTIARWAADMVKDGDAIFLDDSTTTFHMIPFLAERRNLTLVTNGIETALAAAQHAGITVVLIGGVVRPRSVSVVGQLGERSLEGLHIKTAFMSCQGVSLKGGFTDADMATAQLKAKAIAAAEWTVALVESSKFGQVQFSSFALLGQAAHILTDPQVDPSHVNEFRQYTRITVCGDKTTFSYTAIDADTSHYRIGYANLGEQRPFAVAVRRSLEQAAREAKNIDLVTGDNQYDSRVALDVADDLIEAGVDLAVEFHFDDRIGSALMNKFARAAIPLISVDLAIIGATFFGVDNYRAGHDGGIALGKWIAKQWRGQVDRVVIIERPASGAVPATRIMGQLDGLQEVLGEIGLERRICLADTEGSPEAIEVQMTGVLNMLPARSRTAVVAFNDASVEGVIAAVLNAGREKQVACVSQGAGTRLIRDQLRKGSIVVAAILFPPQEYGKGLVNLATRILRRQAVPPAVHIEHVLIDPGSIDQVHPEP